MIVVDASIVVTALADDGDDGDRTRTRLRGERLFAPELIDIEVVSAWRRLVAAGRLDERRADVARHDLSSMRIQRARHQPLMHRSWELRHNFTIYDAAYVALAEMMNATLLTGDGRLAGAPGIRCRTEVM